MILGRDFLQNIGMDLHYDDLTIEWLGNTAPMDSLNNRQLLAREVESYLYQMDLEDEGFDDLEEAYARSTNALRLGSWGSTTLQVTLSYLKYTWKPLRKN